MEVTKVSDRVDALENQSNNENEETKSVGAVNIEFTGKSLLSRFFSVCLVELTVFLGLSDLIHSRRIGNDVPSTVISNPSIDQKITKEGFDKRYDFKNMFKSQTQKA